jgi:hypothetical protein
VIFVDTSAVMYAVGRPHPLREEAQEFFRRQLEAPEGLVTSAEVLPGGSSSLVSCQEARILGESILEHSSSDLKPISTPAGLP